jgi:hypothetical protein
MENREKIRRGNSKRRQDTKEDLTLSTNHLVAPMASTSAVFLLRFTEKDSKIS